MVSIWFSPELTRSTEFVVTSEARGSWFGHNRTPADDGYPAAARISANVDVSATTLAASPIAERRRAAKRCSVSGDDRPRVLNLRNLDTQSWQSRSRCGST
jgi:hypothetical protein